MSRKDHHGQPSKHFARFIYRLQKNNVTKPNGQHQFDLLYIPHNLFEGNTYKYILTGIDVASRFKVARPLKTKKSSEAAFVLEAIYKKGGVFK